MICHLIYRIVAKPGNMEVATQNPSTNGLKVSLNYTITALIFFVLNGWGTPARVVLEDEAHPR